MIRRIVFGLAAALLFVAPAMAQRISVTTASGGTAIAGGACAPGQAANGISTSGAPTGCFVPSGPFAGYKSGVMYPPIQVSSTTTGAAPTVGVLYCSFGQIGGTANIVITNLITRVVTAGTTSAQAALYSNDHTTAGPDRPGVLQGLTATISTTTAGIFSTAFSYQSGITSTPPGSYWWCLEAGDTTVRYQAITGNTSSAFGWLTQVGSTSANDVLGVSATTGGVSTTVSGYGTFPADFTTHTFGWTGLSLTAPAVGFTVQ